MISTKQGKLYLILLLLIVHFTNSLPLNADCRDVGCRNLTKKKTCQRNLATQEFCGDKGAVFCCCTPKKSNTSPCDVIGCSKNCGVCSEGKRRVSFTTNDTAPKVPSFGGFFIRLGFSCCCPNGDVNIDALRCRDISNPCEPSSSTEPRCSSDQRFASFDIYVKDESVSETSPVSSSSSGCPVLLPPGSDCDIGTLERTISCCCRQR